MNHSVLIVDDIADNREILSRRLNRLGYRTASAESGSKALRMVKEDAFSLIILDIMMPEMDGFEVLETLRRSHPIEELPVIMATAKDASQDIVRALELGANDYIFKPIDFPVLIARIKAQLSLKEAHDENRRLLNQLLIRNDFIKSIFGRFISDEVVHRILEAPEGPRLGGERREVSILFADIRGFTALSEKMTPEQVVALLNNYLGRIVPVIEKHGGTINEFYGDGLLAFFGAPAEDQDHAVHAVECALEMNRTLPEVNELNRKESLASIHIGTAVNTGEVVLGYIGSESRFKYGIIGNEVNITSRVQRFAKNNSVIITESCAVKLGGKFQLGEIKTLIVEGLSGPLSAMEVSGD